MRENQNEQRQGFSEMAENENQSGGWVSEEDREAHYDEMLLYGHAVRRALPDGRFEHVPRDEWFFDFGNTPANPA